MRNCNRILLRLAVLTALLLTSTWSARTVTGQGSPAQQARATIDRELNKIRAVQEHRIAIVIDDLHRACDLSDSPGPAHCLGKMGFWGKGKFCKSHFFFGERKWRNLRLPVTLRA